MNKDNVETSLQKLHDGTVGQLNADFEASVGPYRDVVRTLQSRTTGQIEAVAIETVHHELDTAPGATNPRAELPPDMAARTDTVLVVASAPQYPQGVIDPVTEIAALAAEVARLGA